MILAIATRSILRNGRRSAMTLAAIAVSAVAMLLFGAFMMSSILGIRTVTVQEIGHLTVYQRGYFEFGAGNPTAYGIADYRSVMARIAGDSILKPMVRVITPSVSVMGIAGNAEAEASKTFMGTGVVPSDREEMRSWNEYNLGNAGITSREPSGLIDADPTVAVTGIGMARILGLCSDLKQADCPPGFVRPERAVRNVDAVPAQDFSALADEVGLARTATTREPKLDLLAATASGAPNVVSIRIAKARDMGTKAIDDMYVGLHIEQAQKLLYGRQPAKATGIVIQLHHERDMAPARARLAALFKEAGLDLEVRDYAELTPMYGQVTKMFGSMFLFIAIVMGVIVLFTVVNTMSMSVMERVNEIGTTRALGARRSGIRRQFLLEGLLLGLFGSTLGVALSYAVAWLINHGNVQWSPPGYAGSYTLNLPMNAIPTLAVAVWLALLAMATVAALIPANRAARMAVVDALRHV